MKDEASIVAGTEGLPPTVRSFREDLRKLGVAPGMTLIVHSSFKRLGGWVVGGPAALLLALEETLGPEGTLVMPTHTNHLSDPSRWQNPPVPESWWATIREQTPPYQADLTPSRQMGILPELFRAQNGTLRSGHPHFSFAARGKHAEFITANHRLEYGMGDGSPLARMVELGGHALLLGVGHENNTTLHLSEYRAEYETKAAETLHAPVAFVDGKTQWIAYPDIEIDSDDFPAIGEAFERETGLVRRGNIAHAACMLMPQRELVEFGIRWMEANRRKRH